MREYGFGDFRVEVDEETTRTWYEQAGEWDCDCGYCRNFLLLAREGKLPEDVLAVLNKLGIPPEKASYVCEYDERDEKLYYQVNYRMAGRMLEGPETMTSLLEKTELRCGQEYVPGAANDFPEPFFDLTFFLWLPWALPEPIEGYMHKLLISSELEEDTFEMEQLLWWVIPAALTAEGVDVPCEVNVLLTDDEGIHAVNREMRQVDKPTDVLSFPMFELKPGDKSSAEDADPATGLVPLGDMCISLERARAQAEEYGHGVEREIAYLAVHSVLHLLGYDHLDEGPVKEQMREREETILNGLGIGREAGL